MPGSGASCPGEPGPTAGRRLHAPAAARNVGPILEILKATLPGRGTVLEVGSGSGEHVVAFATALPALRWVPSDPDPKARASIASWVRGAGLSNVDRPLALDLLRPDWSAGLGPLDAVIAINVLHVAPPEAVPGLVRGAAAALPEGAALLIYGPFIRRTIPTAPSNRQFDRMLRSWDPAFGLREVEAVAEAAAPHGLDLERVIDMPANNVVVLFRRTGAG